MLRRHRHINGRDKRPFKGEFFGRNDIGPLKKNLVIPNELANKLKMKVRRGRAELMSLKVDSVSPKWSFG